MNKLNEYLNRLNELSNMIYILQDQTEQTETKETASIILGLIYSGSDLETKARIELKNIINK